MRTGGDSGMVLLQVLVIIAIASAAVMLMLTSDDLAVQRSLRFRQAARATAVASGGELSAVVALRRDGVEAPETDDLTEAWAKIGEQDVPIDGGGFSLSIEDAQSRFNLNNLSFDPDRALPVFNRVLEAAQIAPADGALIAGAVLQNGPLADLAVLGSTGLDRKILDQLAQVATALPGRTEVNLNTAGEPLVGALLGDRVLGALLVARRTRSGRLTPTDLRELGTALPQGAGFTSSFYRVSTEVRIGETRQRLTTLLARRLSEGAVEVAAVARRR